VAWAKQGASLLGACLRAGLAYAALTAMKSITFTVMKDGRGYLKTELVPANHTEAQKADTWGLVIAGSLLLMTATFICLLLLSA
jgi:hypothetical protein